VTGAERPLPADAGRPPGGGGGDSPPDGESYAYFEVEADIGVEAHGPTLEACFRQCALAVFNLIVPLDAVVPVEVREVAAQGETPDTLLVNWINELLYLHDVEGFAVRDVTRLELTETRLHARLTGEPVDPGRHPRGMQVKAATFHQLAVVSEPGHVEARLVLDI
jgi:SHS2 domain-containing protein